MGVFDGSTEEKTKIAKTVDLGPIEKQMSLMTTKINLALTEFKTLPFDTTGLVKSDFDFNNHRIFNLTTDSTLDKSGANVKFVKDFIKSVIFPINMNANTITNLPPPSLASDAATKQYVDSKSDVESYF